MSDKPKVAKYSPLDRYGTMEVMKQDPEFGGWVRAEAYDLLDIDRAADKARISELLRLLWEARQTFAHYFPDHNPAAHDRLMAHIDAALAQQGKEGG
jgi:hypothetical protein